VEAHAIPAAPANGHTRELAQIGLSQMTLDPIVNRTVDPKWVEHLAGDFHPLFLGVFHVAEHDGTYKVIDGQHRKLAAEQVGYDEPVAAWIYRGMSVEDQANLFLEVNMQRNVHAIDRFKKAVVAGRPNELAVAKVLADYDLEVGHNADQVGSPGALLAVHRGKGGDDLLHALVDTLTGAWPALGAKALSGEVVSVIAKMERRYRRVDGVQLDLVRLREAFEQVTLVELIAKRDARHRQDPIYTKRHHMAVAIRDAYNEGLTRSKRLAAWADVA
jgi:hypothetical protein